MYNRRAFHKSWSHNKAERYRSCGGHPLKKAWKESFKAALHHPPVNVRELDDRYELHLFASGYEKSDFVIALTDQNLSISVENKKSIEENWKRQEYTPRGFVRQFALNDKIDKEAILAKYENGVLIISLPKLEGSEATRQEIAIA